MVDNGYVHGTIESRGSDGSPDLLVEYDHGVLHGAFYVKQEHLEMKCFYNHGKLCGERMLKKINDLGVVVSCSHELWVGDECILKDCDVLTDEDKMSYSLQYPGIRFIK